MRRAVLRAVGKVRARTDRELIVEIASGNLGALGALYDRYAADIHRFAARTSSAQEAQDVVQTVFLRVSDIAKAFRADAVSARPWLFGITVRVVAERRRSFSRFRRVLAALATRSTEARSPTSDARVDMQAALATLSEAKRVVLLLAEVEGFTCEEIATMLDVPIGTVWTRLHHARREMRIWTDQEPR
jgi:RNA polymerase sigma-70 factor (ECF subfamily)